jgi:hypothetical protein
MSREVGRADVVFSWLKVGKDTRAQAHHFFQADRKNCFRDL